MIPSDSLNYFEGSNSPPNSDDISYHNLNQYFKFTKTIFTIVNLEGIITEALFTW